MKISKLNYIVIYDIIIDGNGGIMAKENNIAIKVENVTKSFKLFYDKPSTLKERLVFWNKKKADEHVVLKDISLDIKKGETVALIGVNGSGNQHY